ncbi:MAG: cupin domain-containing protein [Chloroflexi bacterium]|nr:cupin domain-containing protein [Chloroflexota bacterium]
MATAEAKNFERSDETRPFVGHGKMDIVQLTDGTVGKGVFEPGWRWSQDVKPLAKTDSCQARHLGYVLSGRMRVRMDDGSEVEVGPGDVVKIDPGHDAWTVGDEVCVMVDFAGAAHYAQK